MTDITKARITFGNNAVELEGREEFVSKYLDSFRNLLEAVVEPKQPASREKESPRIELPRQDIQNKTKSEKKSRKKVKSIEAKEFDISKSGDAPSLEEFLKQKSPGKTVGNVIAVIAYYIQEIKKLPSFTEGNIDFVYKVLTLSGRPTHLRQIIINKKNKNLWFEETEDGLAWKLTRTGEIFVQQKLPPKKDKIRSEA